MAQASDGTILYDGPAGGGDRAGTLLPYAYGPRYTRSKGYSAYGYQNENRPYEFNDAAFVNPTYGEWQRRSDAGMGAYGGSGISPKSISDQKALADTLYKRTLGTEPTAADAAFSQAADNNLKAILSASRGGANFRPAINATSSLNTDAASKYMSGAAGEAAANANSLGELYGQLNGMTAYYMQQGLSQDQAAWAARMELEKMRAEQHQSAQATQAGLAAATSRPSPWYAVAGGAASGIGAGLQAWQSRRGSPSYASEPPAAGGSANYFNAFPTGA